MNSAGTAGILLGRLPCSGTSKRAAVPKRRLLGWLELRAGKFHEWKKRYGKVNEHNGLVPRDHWLEPHEQQAILDFERQYPLEGYRG